MAKTLLNWTNEVLKRSQLLRQDELLASLSDSGKQVFIDTAVQAANEILDELYTAAGAELPNSVGEDDITLVADDRDYALPSDLVQLLWPLTDTTNGRLLEEYKGSYNDLIEEQRFPDNYTGIPDFALIRPTDGELYLDRIPSSADAGIVYSFRYVKDTLLSVAMDNFPCTDACFRALVPAGAEIVNRVHKQKFDESMFNLSIGRGARLLTQVKPRDSYA
jgi:hypothetical protein